METSETLIRIVGAVTVATALVALSAVRRGRLVRLLTLLITGALLVATADFGLAWARQLNEGRTNTDGMGYPVMAMLTPLVALAVVLALALVVTHLVLWRAFPTATLLRSQSSKVATWVLTALAALGALAVGFPGAAAPRPTSPVVALGFTQQGKTLLACLADGSVVSWDAEARRSASRWALGAPLALGEARVSAFDPWVAVTRLAGVHLLALPEGGGAARELAVVHADAFAFVGPGEVALAVQREVTLLRPADNTTTPGPRWRSAVTALAPGEEGVLVVADAEGTVSWVELRTGEPVRSVLLPEPAVSLVTFDHGRRAVARAASGSAWVVGGTPAAAVLAPRHRREDAIAPYSGASVLIAEGPSVFRYEAAIGRSRPFFGHGMSPFLMAGHPSGEVAVIAMEGSLWAVLPPPHRQGVPRDVLLLEWPR